MENFRYSPPADTPGYGCGLLKQGRRLEDPARPDFFPISGIIYYSSVLIHLYVFLPKVALRLVGACIFMH